MTAGQNELRMIWLISLVIVGISAWYLELQIVTYLTGLGFLISVMQYISAIEAPMRDLAAPTQVIMSANSKIPLYISSIIAIVGGVTELNWLMGIGITAWIFFLLRWLQRLERNIIQLQSRYRSADQTHPEITQPDIPLPIAAQASPDQSQLLDQIQQWIFRGNPVLKAAIAILVIGIILLLRFATEHWQLSLAVKLGLVALSAVVVTGLGYT